MNAWLGYTEAARQLHDALRFVERDDAAHDAMVDRLTGRLDELTGAAAELGHDMIETAAYLRLPAPDLYSPILVEPLPADEALRRAAQCFGQATMAMRDAHQSASLSPRLPRWPAPARNIPVYVAAMAVGLMANTAWVEFVRYQEAGGADRGLLLLFLPLIPVLVWVGANVVIRMLFTPLMPNEPVDTSAKIGAIICFVPLLLCCCCTGNFDVPYV